MDMGAGEAMVKFTAQRQYSTAESQSKTALMRESTIKISSQNLSGPCQE